MRVLFKSLLKWLTIAGVAGIGISAITTLTGVTTGIKGFLYEAILIFLGLIFIWLMYKLIKR